MYMKRGKKLRNKQKARQKDVGPVVSGPPCTKTPQHMLKGTSEARHSDPHCEDFSTVVLLLRAR